MRSHVMMNGSRQTVLQDGDALTPGRRDILRPASAQPARQLLQRGSLVNDAVPHDTLQTQRNLKCCSLGFDEYRAGITEQRELCNSIE